MRTHPAPARNCPGERRPRARYHVGMTTFIILAALLALDIFLHLGIMSRLAKPRLAAGVTKCLLIPLTYLTLFAAGEAFSRPLANPRLIWLILAFYTFGDFCLLFKNKLFILGVFSFMGGHICYILYFRHFGRSLPGIIIGLAVFGLIYLRFCRKIRLHKPDMAWGFHLYGAMILAFAVGMAGAFSYEHIYSSVLALAGVIAFGWSDSRIAYNMMGRTGSTDLHIMSTYILANLLLASAVFCINVPAS